jgi:isocitrate dehydrogenase
MMLAHIRQSEVAERVHNAWLCTLEDGVRTADLRGPLPGARGGEAASTEGFADAVIDRLGQVPRHLKPVRYLNAPPSHAAASNYARQRPARKEIVGVDVFVHAADVTADALADRLQAATRQPRSAGFTLQMITNRGVKVWPGGFPETFCTDHWRCRFVGVDEHQAPRVVRHGDIVNLLRQLESAGLDFIKTENLCTFDSEAGYALGQGQ